jgi:hypothetical protein
MGRRRFGGSMRGRALRGCGGKPLTRSFEFVGWAGFLPMRIELFAAIQAAWATSCPSYRIGVTRYPIRTCSPFLDAFDELVFSGF